MKLKNLLLSSIILGSVIGNATTTLAAEYDGAEKASSTATITFAQDDESVKPVDPEDPDKPIDPVDPANPDGAELMISYASNFNFGEQSKSGTQWNALADKVFTDDTKTETKEIVPFVATKDARGTDRNGWTLTVKQDGDFIDSDKNILKGAELTLSGLRYVDTNGAPTIAASTLTLTTEAAEVALADANTGVGNWSLALGALEGDEGSQTTTGITLSVPKTTAKNTGTYSTSVTWELAADPAVSK